VGDGVIAIAFFLLFSLLICYCGASTERAGTWCVVSVLLSATVVLLLLLAPKESAAEVEVRVARLASSVARTRPPLTRRAAGHGQVLHAACRYSGRAVRGLGQR
jgi:hypothetical protein